MYGRLSQYTGLHEFFETLSTPNVLVKLIGKPADALIWYAISRDMGNVKNQGGKLIKQLLPSLQTKQDCNYCSLATCIRIKAFMAGSQKTV